MINIRAAVVSHAVLIAFCRRRALDFRKVLKKDDEGIIVNIQPVILCGGSGTRLWPASRARHPKQFMLLEGGSTLFGETLRRIDHLEQASATIVVSSEDCRFYASSALNEAGCGGTVILEPAARNTAPAIALAAFCALEQAEKEEGENDSLLLVLPSDHRFEEPERFVEAVEAFVAE